MRPQTQKALVNVETPRSNGSHHEARDFSHLLGKLQLADRQLKEHFILYEGYVKKLNEISDKLAKADRASAHYSFGEYSELRRREPVAYNGTFLHELYFEALTHAGKTKPTSKTKKAIVEAYGTVEAWAADMKAAASSAHGWALSVWDPRDGKLKTNLVQSEHHVGLFAGAQIVVALDAWEHAYFLQYGTKKADYLTTYFESLDWDVVDLRLDALGR
jgi:Fe-Mn family superoxide dismutase